MTAAQVVDAAKAVFHTILLHRSTGKYTYNPQSPGTFSVGSVGVEDTDCTSMELTYVRLSGDDMDHWIAGEVHGFASSLCQQGAGSRMGKISLEFYERKKPRWLLPAETSNWETWQLTLHVVEPSTDAELIKHQKRLTEELADIVLHIGRITSRPDYVPRNPTSDNHSNVFETRFLSLQPYLHRIYYELPAETMAGTVRKLIRNTFAY